MQEEYEKRWHLVVLRGWLGGWLRCRVIIGATVFKFQKKGKGTKVSKWDAPRSCQLQMVSQHEHLPTPNPGGFVQDRTTRSQFLVPKFMVSNPDELPWLELSRCPQSQEVTRTLLTPDNFSSLLKFHQAIPPCWTEGWLSVYPTSNPMASGSHSSIVERREIASFSVKLGWAP